MNRKIAVIYTSHGSLVNAFKSMLNQRFPHDQIINIADDSLIHDVIQAGSLTSNIARRFLKHAECASLAGADIVVCACSSIGEAAELANRIFDVPVLRIDQVMADCALELGSRIGVLASLETTMAPTVSLIERKAVLLNRPVSIKGMVAQGAYEAQNQGNLGLHDALVREAALELETDCDVIVLAQGSMARMEPELRSAIRIPVLSSPSLCVEEISRQLDGK